MSDSLKDVLSNMDKASQDVEPVEAYMEFTDLPELAGKARLVPRGLEEDEGGEIVIPEFFTDRQRQRRIYVSALRQKIGPERFAELVDEWEELAIKRGSWRGIAELVKLLLLYTAGKPTAVVSHEKINVFDKLMGLIGEAEADIEAQRLIPEEKRVENAGHSGPGGGNLLSLEFEEWRSSASQRSAYENVDDVNGEGRIERRDNSVTGDEEGAGTVEDGVQGE